MNDTAFEVQREWHYTIVENHILEADLSTQAKLLYVILCKYANRNKECYPSYERLMKDVGIKSKATLSNAIKELVDKRILEVVSGKEEGKSNVYIIKDNPLNWIGCSPNEQGGVHQMNRGCSPNEQGGVHQMNRGCSSTVHELKPYNYNHINKIEEEEKEKELAKIFQTFNENIHLISPLEAETLEHWIQKVEPDVVILAIDQAVKYNVRSMKYIENILNNWYNNGLSTKEAVEAYLRDWQDKNNKKTVHDIDTKQEETRLSYRRYIPNYD